MAIQDEMYKAIEKEIDQTVESGTEKVFVNFEKAKETRQINLQAATVSLQVVISLCKRKETAVLKLSFKTAV